MRHFERDHYHLLDWPSREGLTLEHLWQRCPQLVVGRYLINTSYDSGIFVPGESEKAAGWRVIGDHAHSPRIQRTSEIPHDCFDEWLVFDVPTQVSQFETMVNSVGFTPIDFDWAEKREAYWSQIVRLQPLHVLGENDGVYVITREADIIVQLKDV